MKLANQQGRLGYLIPPSSPINGCHLSQDFIKSLLSKSQKGKKKLIKLEFRYISFAEMARNGHKKTGEKKKGSLSKHGARIFKEAFELCNLCGVEMLILLFSPSGKTYSFANPSVETIANRFLRDAKSGSIRKISSGRDEEGDHMKRIGQILKQMSLECEDGYLFTKPVGEQTMEEMVKFKAMLEDLKKKLQKRFVELGVDPSTIPFFRDKDFDDDDGPSGIDSSCASSYVTPHFQTVGFGK